MPTKSFAYSKSNPYNMMMWLALLASGIAFVFLLLVFSTRVGAVGWTGVPLPKAFTFSTFTIALSSLSLYLAHRSFQSEHYASAFRWHAITFALAIAFCLLQVAGWMRLKELGLEFNQISGAFIYLLSGLHLAHILFGLFGLGWILIDSYHYQSYVEGFIQSLNPTKLIRLKLFNSFWHFVGGLWLLLFLVLQLNY